MGMEHTCIPQGCSGVGAPSLTTPWPKCRAVRSRSVPLQSIKRSHLQPLSLGDLQLSFHSNPFVSNIYLISWSVSQSVGRTDGRTDGRSVGRSVTDRSVGRSVGGWVTDRSVGRSVGD